jgi:hypothetical protein
VGKGELVENSSLGASLMGSAFDSRCGGGYMSGIIADGTIMLAE